MYNYIFLVGRIVRDIEIRKTPENKSVATLCLAVTKPFKNAETGTYDTDFINVTLWEQICEITKEHCKKGDLVGVKGRISTRKETTSTGLILTHLEIISERVVFISSNKNTED